MNIYDYNWWEVFFIIVFLEIAAVVMAWVLMNIRADSFFKAGSKRKKKRYL